MKQHLYHGLMALAAVGILAGSASAVRDDQPSPYYEDDAWYDVSEWFDGNDYNPTDEALGRWDDETFDFADERTSTDRDSDTPRFQTRANDNRDYGYFDNTAEDDRWFFDRYNDGYADWFDYDDNGDYDAYTWYFDGNGNGVYDSYAYFEDTNGDGTFDYKVYYPYDLKSKFKDMGMQKADQQAGFTTGKSQKVVGEVQRVKTVSVRGTTHTVAEVQTNDGNTLAVDMGSGKKTIEQNAKVDVKGPMVKVGDKRLVIAMSGKLNGQDLSFDRTGRRYSGKIVDTHKVTIRGRKHVMAKLNTSSGKKMLVDLGRDDSFAALPGKGEMIKVDGVPVKVKDRVVLMARNLTWDGKTQATNRRPENSGDKR